MSELNKHYNYLAVFDLDRTIIPFDSSITLVKEGYKQGLLSTLKLKIGFFYLFAHKMRILPTKIVIKKISKWLNGIPENEIQKLTNQIFNETLIASVYKDVLNEIEIHRNKNAYLIILSSSISAFCELFREKLNFNHAFSTVMETKNGYLTGQTLGEFCHGEEKLIRLKEFCLINNFTLEKVYFYSDSVDDLPTLSAIGFPVCINPDNKLRQIADKNKWPIYYWIN
jgi:HAD superfamily hydrolase (TIGR01490 family)